MHSLGPILLLCALFGCGGSDFSPFGPQVAMTEESSPSWRPGTNVVAYASHGTDITAPGVYVVDVDRPEREFVIPGCFAPEWSLNGRFLACDCSNGILVLDYESGERHVLYRTLDAYGVSWAPDGASLIGERGSDSRSRGIWQFDVTDMTPPRRITPDGIRAVMACWSAARNEIVFVGNETDLYLINPDGSGLRRLTESDGVIETYPEWSPDGRFIAYADHDGIRLLEVSTSRSHRLEGTSALRLDTGQRCSWSSDGTRLAYNRVKLWVIDASGANNHEIK